MEEIENIGRRGFGGLFFFKIQNPPHLGTGAELHSSEGVQLNPLDLIKLHLYPNIICTLNPLELIICTLTQDSLTLKPQTHFLKIFSL